MAVIEMALLEEAKQTDNKVRWDADVDGTKFSLYVPKFRVPSPTPRHIQVDISADGVGSTQPTAALRVVAPLDAPIVAQVIKFATHTKTIRYRPEGEASSWEIGEPYIPTPMTFGEAEQLTITVKWLTGH